MKRYLLYTTEPGGKLQFGNPEHFREAKATGLLDVTPNDVDRDHEGFEPTYVKPHYIALVRTTHNWDFQLGKARQ